MYHNGAKVNECNFYVMLNSVTRFGEISPLWQNFNSLLEILLRFWFGIWQTLVPAFANLCYWANFQWYKRQKIEKYYSHLVILMLNSITFCAKNIHPWLLLQQFFLALGFCGQSQQCDEIVITIVMGRNF